MSEDAARNYAGKMKRYGKIFDEFSSMPNLYLAYRNARVGKGHYREVRDFELDVEENLEIIRRMLISGEWRVHPYKRFITFEHGKRRVIDWDPSFIDNIIQHAVEQTAGKILLRSMIRDTYAGIRRRGVHDGVERMRGFLSEYLQVQSIYVMKTDIRHFYQSVDHEILKRKLTKKIKDERMLDVMFRIIDSHTPGLPIGNYLSQLLANFYLSDYDHWVKAQGFRHYSRYCDDVVVLSHDKAALRDLMMKSINYLAEDKLAVNGNYQVFPIERPGGLDFLGYVFTRDRVFMRKSVERNFRRAARNHLLHPSLKNLRSLGAYWGWVKYLTHGKRFWESVLEVDFKKLYHQEVERCRV